MILRKILLNFLLKGEVKSDISDRDDAFEKKFLNNLSTKKGWKSYLAMRDLSLMKQMAKGVTWNEYITLLGQRKELFILASEAIKYKKLKDTDFIERKDMKIKGVEK